MCVCLVCIEHFNSAKESFADYTKLAIVMTQFILYELIVSMYATICSTSCYFYRLWNNWLLFAAVDVDGFFPLHFVLALSLDNVDKSMQLAAIRLFLKHIVARFIQLNVWPPFKLNNAKQNRTKQNWRIEKEKKKHDCSNDPYLFGHSFEFKARDIEICPFVNWNLIWLVFARASVCACVCVRVGGWFWENVCVCVREHVWFLQLCFDNDLCCCCWHSFFCHANSPVHFVTSIKSKGLKN